MKIAVIISAIAEWKAVREIYPALEIASSPYGETAGLKLRGFELELFHSGWGKIASAGAVSE